MKKEENKINEEMEKEVSNVNETTDGTVKTQTAEESEKAEEKTDTEEKVEQEEEKDPLEVAQAQVEELKDKYVRLYAEFENYKKRTMREKTELILNGAEKTVLSMLPVVDDMERAIANVGKSDDIEALREGFSLIFDKFTKALGSLGVKAIDTQDKDFDTEYHEAIAMVPGMGDDKKGKVIDCVQTGYTLNDKVIRHAKVAVGQ